LNDQLLHCCIIAALLQNANFLLPLSALSTLVTSAMITDSASGWFYLRGQTKSKNVVIYYRPGVQKFKLDPSTYARTIMYTLDLAARTADVSSNGKYVVVLDCSEFSFSQIPAVAEIKKVFAIMSEHFPNRTQRLLIVNLGIAANAFYTLSKPLIPDGTRQKIEVSRTANALFEVMDKAQIPTWLGGEDDYVFNAEKYFNGA